MKLFLYVCLLSFPVALQAQQLSGIISNRKQESVSGVFVDNSTRGQTSISNENGEYYIAAQPGDTIIFSLMGYETVRIIVPAAVQGSMFRRISMQRAVFTLDEVQVNSRYTPYQIDSMERRRTYSNELTWQKERSVMSPISALADNISRKSRMRWGFQRNFGKWEAEKFAATRYTPELVKSLTGLEGNDCYQFMAAYPMDADYARVASDMEIQMWIRYNYRNWIKKPLKERIQALPDFIPE